MFNEQTCWSAVDPDALTHRNPQILKADDLAEVHRAQDCLQYIVDIKFSPNGEVLAVASNDGSVYLYEIDNEWNLRATFSKHMSAVTHLDFDTNSEFLQTNDKSYELLFSNVADGRHIPDSKALRDIEWATQTCTLGWSVQGVWPAGARLADINCCSRSHDQMLVATGDDFAQVKLFNYPCVEKGSGYKTFHGHSSHVTNVCFSKQDEYLISVGGSDR